MSLGSHFHCVAFPLLIDDTEVVPLSRLGVYVRVASPSFAFYPWLLAVIAVSVLFRVV